MSKSSIFGAPNLLEPADIGVTVQAYDADTLKADTADVLTAGFSVSKAAKTAAILTLNASEPNILSWSYTGDKTLNKPSTSDAASFKIYVASTTGTLTLGTGVNLVSGVYSASEVNVITVDYDGASAYVYIAQVA